MIPDFPKFKNISMEDREAIISLSKNSLPYSDYNFISLWSWNTAGETKCSQLNNNLIIKMPDYISDNEIICFIGNNKVDETALEIFNHSKKKTVDCCLTLIPEQTAIKFRSKNILVEEDKDNHDYIFSTKKLAMLEGKEFKSKRNLSIKFLKNNPEAIFKTSPVSDPGSQKQILEVLIDWQKDKNSEVDQENIAIRRILKLAKIDDTMLILSGVYLHDNLLAFSIDEILSDGYALSHFFKAKYTYTGVSEYLNQRTAHYLFNNHVKLWSWEQDLGLYGLRKSKTSYRPVQALKKFKIRII